MQHTATLLDLRAPEKRMLDLHTTRSAPRRTCRASVFTPPSKRRRAAAERERDYLRRSLGERPF